MKQDRVHKWIAASGIMSRRKAEEAIRQGRVALNGVVFTDLGRTLDPAVDRVSIDGAPVAILRGRRTFLFYKPRGVMTTKSDPEGRPTVMDYFKDLPGLNPVGRLDLDSEGLLLMTEDGDLLLRMTHPRFGVEKVYEVEVEGQGIAGYLELLCQGLVLSDGEGRFVSIEVLRPGRAFRVVVNEGRNRFVRRMLAAVGFTVRRLIRVRMGPYELGTLRPGERMEVPL
jgi:23S rRNA pseudouridine2605 synthase